MQVSEQRKNLWSHVENAADEEYETAFAAIRTSGRAALYVGVSL